jgi:hypothetical protein
MNNFNTLRATVAAIVFLFTSAANAHHSFATHYDTTNVVEISGVLSGVKMRSPHSFFEVDVVVADGTTETWEVEAHAVPILRRLGITRETLKVGDTVTIKGPRSRRPEKLLLFGAKINTSSGEEFEMLDSIRRAPDYAISDTREGVTGIDRFTGKWMTFIAGQSLEDSPMPLNEVGQEARENFNAAFNTASECVPSNLPSLIMIPYVYEIKRDGNHVLASMWDPNGNGADIPSSTQKELIERYTVNEDGSVLTVEYTVTDPAYLSQPYTAKVVWHRMPFDSPIYDFTCDAEIATRSTQNAAVLDD